MTTTVIGLQAWTTAGGARGIQPLPRSPLSSAEPLEDLVLVPYGATNIRISVFPQLCNAGDAGCPPPPPPAPAPDPGMCHPTQNPPNMKVRYRSLEVYVDAIGCVCPPPTLPSTRARTCTFARSCALSLVIYVVASCWCTCAVLLLQQLDENLPNGDLIPGGAELALFNATECYARCLAWNLENAESAGKPKCDAWVATGAKPSGGERSLVPAV